ncbi:DUF1134 domain-containing protein [Croceicoccus naphthovorans]|uniref:Uncharacterized protein n=1 Tax=Croceicoccus naphthovorans TaxID=1348774 RepID=A0A0G3XEK2_9SPHN|nr:DUF1134 domain-containing protein [Croceicoccus naphthovorans]AKM08813.1 hypothetical protein AB433_00495 [Croceicoccus naphthovorans]MBB3991706.1 hypothetical protein [Croceicoccus naphthovorans]
MIIQSILGRTLGRKVGTAFALAAASMLASTPAHAQMQTIDPDSAIDGDLAQSQTGNDGQLPPVSGDPYAQYPAPAEPTYPVDPADPYMEPMAPAPNTPAPAQPVEQGTTVQTANSHETYQEDDLIGAAEGVFGKGAEGLADVIQDILKKQGQPNAYIVGREAGGAFAIGVRYGSGTMHHKVEGEQPVYWTGPSIGFDAGANAGSTFVLVYNLWDSEELFERFPSGEGQAYLVGGFNVSYMRKGDVVLIPVRVGAGLRLGVNAGYMKFSKKQRWLPF